MQEKSPFTRARVSYRFKAEAHTCQLGWISKSGSGLGRYLIDMGIPLKYLVPQGEKEIRIKLRYCGRYTVERKVRPQFPQASALRYRTT